MSEDGSTTYTIPQIMMTLAAISYADPASGIPAYLGERGLATQGQWQLVWGPGESETNLMYVTYNQARNSYAVAIRGTYPHFDLTMLLDVYDDLDVGNQLEWQDPPVPGALVAAGALSGLDDLASLAWGGQTLLEFLEARLAEAGGDLWVTGHSLGGCLTTVLAPWLRSQLGGAAAINTCTFAAPTAGNQVFAEMYDQLFPSSARFWNSLDVVPNAWADLEQIEQLFPEPGPPCPLVLQDVVELIEDWLADADDVSYSQTNGAGTCLDGSCGGSDDWFAEASDQHGHNTYLALLGAPTLDFVTQTVKVRRNKSAAASQVA
ncbi:MAG: lipase family protein [Kouleothrix sp.]|nr:lipase family protein [Kouleothrix sp.]